MRKITCLMAVLVLSLLSGQSAWADYGTPGGDYYANNYLTSITTTGAQTNLSYSASSHPGALYNHIEDKIVVQAGSTFTLNLVANSLGGASSSTVREDIRYCHASLFTDFTGSGSFGTAVQTWGNKPPTNNVYGNYDLVMNITATISVPSDASLGTTRMRVIYTNAWKDWPSATDTQLNKGIVYDFDVEVVAPAASHSITYVYKLDGTELYRTTESYQEDSMFPAYDNIPSYMDVTVSPELPATVTADGTYEVNTTLKSDSPFKFSSSLSDPQWVTMKVLYSKNLPGRPSEGAVNYDAANWITNANPYVGITKDASTAENYANYMWAFVGDWYHGYKIYSYADKTKMWGYGKDGFITSNNIANRAIQLYDSEVNENLRTWQIVKWQGTDGADNYAEETYSLVLVNTDHPNFYAGEHLAADQYKLGTWMTSTTGNTAAHNRIAIADPLPIYTAYAQTVLDDAGKVGYPKTTSGGATQLESALTSATKFSELYGYVENFRSESDVVLPTDGKAYILKAHFTGSDKYVTLGSEKLTTSETEGATFICHQLDNGKFVFVNNKGFFFNKVGNFTAYSDWTEFTLLHSYGDVAQTYGTFGMQDLDYKYLTVNGTSFQQGNEGIAETSTTAFYLEETTYANNPAMTTAQGIDEEKKIATFSAPFAFTLPAGIDAYIVKQTKTDGTASLTKLASEGEVVAANTGVILLGTTAESNVLMIPATTTGVTDAESMLGNTAGAPKDIVSAGNNYILAKNDEGYIIFSKALEGANGKNLAMNKAYLTVPGGSTSQFKIDFGGTTTAIETIATEGNNNSAAVYDLSGRRVSTPAHRGIYIRNGKKFMVK